MLMPDWGLLLLSCIVCQSQLIKGGPTLQGEDASCYP